MNFKSIFYLLMTLIWFTLCWRYYTCNIKKQCNFGQVQAASTIDTIDKRPILFKLNSDSAILNNFESYRDSLVELSKGKNVDIIGYFNLDEVNNTSFPNLGLARADKLKQLLASKIDTSKIFISHEYNGPNDRKIFEATVVSFSDSINLNSDKAQIVSRKGVLEVYFPASSNKNIKDKAFDSSLHLYMEKAFVENKKISITGHTDNTGLENTNITLSKERAETIKKKIISLGAKAENISIEGKGSSMPKTDNNSTENRALNRRVEIKF